MKENISCIYRTICMYAKITEIVGEERIQHSKIDVYDP